MLGDSFRVAESQRQPHIVSLDNMQSEPITTSCPQQPPQQDSRNEIVNQVEKSSEDLTSNLNIGKNGAQSENSSRKNNGNKKSWPKSSNCSDQNQRSISSESIVINLDNVKEPSTSYSVDSHGPQSARLFPEQCQLEISADGDQNLPNETSEINNSGGLNSSGYVDNNNSASGADNSEEPHDNGFTNNNTNIPVPEDNEGTQTDNSNMRPIPDTNRIDKIINQYTPFITFLTLKGTYDHREGILIFVGLLVTFIHANSVIKREVAKQNRRSFISLGIVFVNLFVSIGLIYFVFQDQQLYKNLIFIPPYSQLLSIWDVLWTVGITDFVLKFITMQLKVGMVCFPGKFLPYSARGKWYLFLERASQLYRSLAPIQPWLYYLMEIYQGSENTVGMFFSISYIFLKGSDITTKVKLFVKAFWKLLHNTSLGTRPSKEQMITVGSQCPICHDEYNSPIKLQCCHIFCESCVSVWFDREQTCPLCRAKIADKPTWRNGATTLFIQLF